MSFEGECRAEEEKQSDQLISLTPQATDQCNLSGKRWPEGVFDQPWKRASEISFPTIPYPPDLTPALQRQWSAMKTHPGELVQQYFRYFCVESNIMESAFLLNSRVTLYPPPQPLSLTLGCQSLMQLIRGGYEESSIDYLSNSAIQDKRLIAEILRDTHKVSTTDLYDIFSKGQLPQRLPR
jgi:hypothetical protein